MPKMPKCRGENVQKRNDSRERHRLLSLSPSFSLFVSISLTSSLESVPPTLCVSLDAPAPAHSMARASHFSPTGSRVTPSARAPAPAPSATRAQLTANTLSGPEGDVTDVMEWDVQA